MAENKNVAEKSKGWFKGLKSEFKKVVWQSKEGITKQTIAVVVITFVVGVLIALIDMGLQYGVNFLSSFGI